MAGERTVHTCGRDAYLCVYGEGVEWTAEKIKTERQKRGLTQAELAKLVSASTRTITSWEAGDASPQGRFLHALDKALLDPQPVTETDVRDLDDEELWERKRETDRELERRFFHRNRRAKQRPPAGSFAEPPEHLRRKPDDGRGRGHPGAASSDG